MATCGIGTSQENLETELEGLEQVQKGINADELIFSPNPKLP